MSSQTTNLHLAKPDYSEAADIAVINSDMDLIDNYAGSTTTSLANTQSSLAYIVGNTNTTGGTLSVGTYVYVKGHNTISEGLRKVTASIANNGNITTSNTSACTGGGINDAYASLNSNITTINSKMNESWTTINTYYQYCKRANVVYVRQIADNGLNPTSYTELFTLPEGYRPNTSLFFYSVGNLTGEQYLIKIDSYGKVYAIGAGNTGTMYSMSICFPV